jgi:probable phosphoglycerate mutase
LKLYIIRHADPDYVADGLTATGYQEAALLAERLAVEGLTHLYTSPLGRARLTAHDTAERLKKSVTVLD